MVSVRFVCYFIMMMFVLGVGPGGLSYADISSHKSKEQLFAEKLLKQSASAFGKNSMQYAGGLVLLGRAHLNRNRYSKAEKHYRHALRILIKLKGKDDRFVGGAYLSLAHLYEAQGQFAKAMPYAHKSLALQEKHYGRDHLRVLPNVRTLGRLNGQLKRFAKAKEYFELALKIAKKSYGAEHRITRQIIKKKTALK